MTTQTTYTILNNAIADSQELLTQYSLSENLLADLTTAFGSEYDSNAAQELVKQWQTGEFGAFPELEIRSAAEINGANGAYSADTNKIYISEEYLQANADDVKAVRDLILEEYGHFVDASINRVNAAGDEGAIFSGLVQGESFTNSELQQLQLENDNAVITLDGQEIAIEQQTDTGSDLFAFRIIGRDSGFTFGSGGFTSFDEFPRQLADIDGDGKADIVAFGENEVLTSLSNGDGTFGSTIVNLNNDFTVDDNFKSFDRLPRQLADINGDGLADIIGFGKSRVFTALSKGDGTFEDPQRVLNEFSVNKGFTSFDEFPRQVADVDGDGLADIIGFGEDSVFVSFSKGDGTFEEPQRALDSLTVNKTFTSFDKFPRQVADVDGDGKADIVAFGFNRVTTSLAEPNVIRGTENNDTLTAPDDDNYFIEGLAGNDLLNGDGGNDTIEGGTGSDTLNGGSGSDSLLGNSGIDTLMGGDGNDFLDGGNQRDFLDGGNGNDTLNGGAGTNNLVGGAGNDTFVIKPDGLQNIQDFERGTDKIDITASDATQIRLAPNGENTNVVNQSNEVLATVEGQIISTEDLTLVSESEQQSLFPELNISEQNITELIKAWGDEFAEQQGSSIDGDIDMSRVNFELSDIDFAQSIEIPSSGTSNTSIFRNTTGSVASQTIETRNEKELTTTITTENQTSLGTTEGVQTNTGFSVSNTLTTFALHQQSLRESKQELKIPSKLVLLLTSVQTSRKLLKKC